MDRSRDNDGSCPWCRPVQIADTRVSFLDDGCSTSRCVKQPLTAPQYCTSSMLVDRLIVDVIEANYSKTVGNADEQNTADTARPQTGACELVERLMMVARPAERVPSPAVRSVGRRLLSPRRWHLKEATTLPLNRIIPVCQYSSFLLKGYRNA